MASPIDICNLALAHLGEDPSLSSIDPPEGSAHAEKCARFYPIARDIALESMNWPFAMSRVLFAELPAALPTDAWEFAYALPSDCMRAVGVLMPEVIDEEQHTSLFVIEGRTLYTNAEDATLRYTTKVTDTTRFSPMFVQAVSWLLASYLAGAICEDKAVKQWAYEMYREELGNSAQSQANQSKTVQHHVPNWISQR